MQAENAHKQMPQVYMVPRRQMLQAREMWEWLGMGMKWNCQMECEDGWCRMVLHDEPENPQSQAELAELNSTEPNYNPEPNCTEPSSLPPKTNKWDVNNYPRCPVLINIHDST